MPPVIIIGCTKHKGRQNWCFYLAAFPNFYTMLAFIFQGS